MARFSSVQLSLDRLRANYAPGVHDTGAETTNLLEICCTQKLHTQTLAHLCKQIN